MGGQDRIRAVVVDTVCVMGVAINLLHLLLLPV
jgi:hypothetical protein